MGMRKWCCREHDPVGPGLFVIAFNGLGARNGAYASSALHKLQVHFDFNIDGGLLRGFAGAWAWHSKILVHQSANFKPIRIPQTGDIQAYGGLQQGMPLRGWGAREKTPGLSAR